MQCKVNEFSPSDSGPEVSPTCDENAPLYTGVQKRVVQGDGLASVQQEQLSVDGDSDSLTTSPSSSSLDTYSSNKLYKAFSKPTAQGLGQVPSGPGGAPLELEAGSGSSFSEADACCEDQPRMARSVTDGEMRRALSPSNYHGVSPTCCSNGNLKRLGSCRLLAPFLMIVSQQCLLSIEMNSIGFLKYSHRCQTATFIEEWTNRKVPKWLVIKY